MWRRVSQWNPTAIVALVIVVVVVIVGALRTVGAFVSAELALHDAMIRARAETPSAPPSVVVIGARDQEITALGWPLSDGVLADLLARLLQAGPRAIGVDIYRDHPIGDPAGTKRLHDLLAGDDRVVWVTRFGDGETTHIPPPAPLIDSEGVGFADMIPDPGGIVRRALLFLDDGETAHYALPLRLAIKELAAQDVALAENASDPTVLDLGETAMVPLSPDFGGYIDVDARGYQYMVDYRQGVGAIPVIHLSDVLNGQFDAQAIAGRIVLIGVTAASVKDYFSTPFSQDFFVDQTTYGVVLHGIMVDQLIRHAVQGQAALSGLGEGWELLWVVLCIAVGGLLARTVISPIPFALSFALLLAGVVLVSYGAFLNDLWLPTVPSALGLAATAGFGTSVMLYRERMDRAQLMTLFSRHVSDTVAEEIWHRRDEFMDSGRPKPQQLQATVLFTDIKGFTSISERLDEVELIEWLNTFMESMAGIVVAHDALVDKYIGDAIMAVFGVPLPRTEPEQIRQDALSAVHCALAMAEEIKRLNKRQDDIGLPVFGMRVGIHTGTLVAGSVGSAQRLEYTVIGDTVNVAARLESYAGNVEAPDACDIVISQDTRDLLDGDFEFEAMGEIPLKGKAQPVGAFRLLGKIPHGQNNRENAAQ